MSQFVVPFFLISFLAFLILKRRLDSSKGNPHGLPYPPGPKPLPILGNIRDIPGVCPWITYTAWGPQYGDIMHISVVGQHIVVINSVKIAMDILERRSQIYSSRPHVPMVDLMGWDIMLALFPYGDVWRAHRRIFQQRFRPELVNHFQPIETAEAHKFLVNLLDSPEDFIMHARTYPASLMMYLAYGHETAPKNDRMVKLADDAGNMLSIAFTHHAMAVVNLFPSLRYLPEWFPGAGFQKHARICRQMVEQMLNEPFDFVKQNMSAGTAVSSLASDLLQQNNEAGGDKDKEQIIKEAAATTFSAGADTSAAALKAFFHAMVLNPEAQAKAQAEIDAVVGCDRLPHFDDRESLPYVGAIYRELLRFRPPTPSVPHLAMEDDVYDGFFLPKNAVVIPNIWAMTRNEDLYPEPERFIPERFLNSDGSLNDDNTILSFGFGRRICVGRHLAAATVWLGIASVLALFDIRKAKDGVGRDVKPNVEYSDGVVSHAMPFPCSILPRSEKAKRLILDNSADITR